MEITATTLHRFFIYYVPFSAVLEFLRLATDNQLHPSLRGYIENVELATFLIRANYLLPHHVTAIEKIERMLLEPHPLYNLNSIS